MLDSFFGHPWILGALLAASLPWIIEWLFRRRKRQVELPTLRYLLKTKEQEQVKRQDRILLLLRTAGVALLVLGVARPIIQHQMFGAGANRRVAIVLDETASMHQRVGVTTSFALAQKKAAAMVRSLPKETTVSVITLGDRADTVVDAETDMYTAAGRIESLRAGSGAGSMADALTWIKDYLEKAQWQNAEIYFFSDFQKHTWLSADGRADVVAQKLRDVDGHNEVFLVDVGGTPTFNYVVTALAPTEKLLAAGRPMIFNARVEATGNVPKDKVARVTFLVDGDMKAVREIPAGGSGGTLAFEHRFAGPGEFLVEVQVDGDEHPIDNRRMYLCQVPEDVKVLIVDENAGSPASDTYFLAKAIEPMRRPGTERVSQFSVKTIGPSQLPYENLEPYRAVAISAVANVNEALSARMERYVADGGSVWFFLGPKVSALDYNKFLYKEGRGLLPAKLAETSTSPKPAPHFVFAGAQHPAFAAIQGGDGKDDAQVSSYMKLTVGPEAGGATLATLSNGEPAMVRRDFGRGQTVLCCSTAGPEWTVLPALPEFPVMVQEMLKSLAGDPDAAVNLNAGERFNSAVYVSAQHLLLKRPDGSKERLTPRKKEGQEEAWSVAYERTDLDGEYLFADVAKEVLARRRFVVNPRTEEGDLSRLQQNDFADLFGSGSWRWMGPEQSVEDFASKLHSVTELAPMILLILTAMLGVESFFAVAFGRRRTEEPA